MLSALPAAAHAADDQFASLANAPLARGAGYDAPNGSAQVRHLQRQLRRLNEHPGPIDGLFGPLTDGAVRRFQSDAGLRVDGLVGPKTARRLARKIKATTHRAVSAREPVSVRPRIQPTTVADRRTDGGTQSSGTPVTEPTAAGIPSLVAALLLTLLATIPLVLGVAWYSRRRARYTGHLSGVTATSSGDEFEDPGLPPRPSTAAVAAAGIPRQPDPAPNVEEPIVETASVEEPIVETPLVEEPGRPARAPDNGRFRRGAVIGYVTVPDDERFKHGEVYEQQAKAIAEFCRNRGLRLARIVRDVESPGQRSADAPGLQHACEALARGEARALVVESLARVTHSPARLGLLLRWLVDADRALIAIDNGFDTSTAVGRLVSAALIEVGDWDRDRAARRRAPSRRNAAGRRDVRDVPELHARIAAMREAGLSLQAIADTLNAEGVPTLRGGSHWRPSSVQAAVGYKRPGARGLEASLMLPETPPPHFEKEDEEATG